jgi:hypothetical protein
MQREACNDRAGPQAKLQKLHGLEKNDGQRCVRVQVISPAATTASRGETDGNLMKCSARS